MQKPRREPDRRLPETALRNLARIRGEDKDLFVRTRRVGLNAHWTLDAIAAEFAPLRAAEG